MSDLKQVQDLGPFKHFCMSIGNLPSSYMESMSYLELLMWFCNYLENTVIPTIDNNAECIKELQNLYIILKNYVDNYFTNLDVQKEINNKLDSMALDGSLTTLIKKYIDPIHDDFMLTIQEQIKNISNKVDIAVGGAPIPVDDMSKMSDTNHIYLLTTTGHWYWYNNSNWVDGGVYQATQIADKSITPDKTNFIFPFINLYDNNNDIDLQPGYIDQKTGNPASKPNWFTTGFLQVHPNQIYSTNYNFIVNFYDINKNWISGTNGSTSKNTFIVPNNPSIVFCRLSLNYYYYKKVYLYAGNYDGSHCSEYNTTNLEPFVKIDSNNLNSYLKRIINDMSIDVSLTLFKDPNSESKNRSCDFALSFDIPSNTKKIFISYDIDTDFYKSQFICTYFASYSKTLGNGSYIKQLSDAKSSSHIETTLENIPENSRSIKCNANFSNLPINQNLNFKIKNLLIIVNDNILINNSEVIVGPFWPYEHSYAESSFINYYLKDNDYSDNDNTFINKNIVIMGDSITWLKGEKSWINYMQDKINFKNITNLALSGACWANKSTTEYDIINTPSNATPNNVIWNQVNRLINMTDNSIIEPPDIVFILAGTNDQWIDNAKFYGDVNTAFTGSITDKPVTEILTVAESIRYNCELLLQKYPNCQIILATMLQRGISNESTIYSLNELVKECAHRLSVDVIDQTYKSGIYGYNEINSHIFLYDGTHPNAKGAKKIGYFLANELKNKIFV